MSNNRKKTAHQTQFEIYSRVWDRFAAELAKSTDRHVMALAQSWETSKATYAKLLSDPNSRVTRSQIGTGMKQGLRETPLVLSGCPSEIRAPLLKMLVQILREEAPELFEKDKIELGKIVKRGQVRSENEFYLVRSRVDEIEGKEELREELTTLYRLLDKFDRVGSGDKE